MRVASLPSSHFAFATASCRHIRQHIRTNSNEKLHPFPKAMAGGRFLNQCTCWALKICHSCSTAACSAICSSACPVAGAFGPIPGSRLSSSCLVFIGGRVRCTGCMARSNLTRASSSISRSVSSRTAPSVRSSNQNCGRCGHFEVPMWYFN
jgi:hypothetical protein